MELSMLCSSKVFLCIVEKGKTLVYSSEKQPEKLLIESIIPQLEKKEFVTTENYNKYQKKKCKKESNSETTKDGSVNASQEYKLTDAKKEKEAIPKRKPTFTCVRVPKEAVEIKFENQLSKQIEETLLGKKRSMDLTSQKIIPVEKIIDESESLKSNTMNKDILDKNAQFILKEKLKRDIFGLQSTLSLEEMLVDVKTMILNGKQDILSNL